MYLREGKEQVILFHHLSHAKNSMLFLIRLIDRSLLKQCTFATPCFFGSLCSLISVYLFSGDLLQCWHVYICANTMFLEVNMNDIEFQCYLLAVL